MLKTPAATIDPRACLKRADGARPRLLIAEDFESARILTAALLRRMGCDVDTAEHGEEALAQARHARYDIILLDIEMPVMDGVCAAREIRLLEGDAAKTPLMALSAFLARFPPVRSVAGGLRSGSGEARRPCGIAPRDPDAARSQRPAALARLSSRTCSSDCTVNRCSSVSSICRNSARSGLT